MNQKIFEKYIKKLPKKAKVLDAGCGTGNNSRYLLSLRKDLEITAIDIDEEMRHEVPKKVTFKIQSVEDMKDFKDNTFDCVICFHVIEHLNNPQMAVKEFYRVLKPKRAVFAESPHWISTIMPVGYNFYDDPTHIRPHNKTSFSNLFNKFKIEHLGFDTPIFYYLNNLYAVNSSSLFFRKVLKALGLYRTTIFIMAKKK